LHAEWLYAESLLEEYRFRGEIVRAERLERSATVLFAVQGEVALE